MQFAGPTDEETFAALDQMKKAVRTAFCGVMQTTRLPPMAAMSLAAMAVGSLYLEVAAAHRGVLVNGVMSPLGRALLAADPAGLLQAAADLLAPASSSGRFGSDLTVMVAGSPSAAVSHLLDTCADREGRGAAVVLGKGHGFHVRLDGPPEPVGVGLAADAVGLRVLDGGRVALDPDAQGKGQLEPFLVGEA